MKNRRPVWMMLSLLRVGLGIFFLVTGLLKINDMGETAEFLTRSDILPEFFSMPLACIGVAMELVVAGSLLLRRSYRGGAAWGLVMCSVFVLLYTQAWIRGLQLSCNCTGNTHVIENYPLDIGMRLLLVGAMVLLVWDSRRHSSTLWDPDRSKYDFSEI